MPSHRAGCCREALPNDWEWLGGHTEEQGVVGRLSRRAGSGREALPEGREVLPECQEWFGCTPRGPGVVEKPGGPGVVGRPSRMVGGPPRGSGVLPGGL